MMISLKYLYRRCRLAFYHWRSGPDFYFAGHPVTVPDHMFSIKRVLMKDGYELPERIMVERHLDPALPLIELGGSLGILSSLLARKLNAGTRYDIVEANSAIIDVCEQNAKSGSPTCTVNIHNLAIAYGADEVSFHASENIHISKLSTNGNVTVKAVTLSKLLTLAGSPEQYTLVMDIEGAEYDVFENDPQAFANCTLAIVETHPKAFAERQKSEDDFLRLVSNVGLKVVDQIKNTYTLRRV
jgi:FkbM family methyltransferase